MLGVDLVKIERIEKLLDKFGEKFLKRIFNEEEIVYITNKGMKVETVAGMYASKEAVSKAYGTGIGEIKFKDINIKHNPVPMAVIKEKTYCLSVSHDGEYAVAVCILNK